MLLIKTSVTIIYIFVLLMMNNIHVFAAEENTQPNCLCLEKVVDGLHSPVEYLTVKRDNLFLNLVVEQRGVVRAFLNDDSERKAVFMNITDRVTTSNAVAEERGLLSVAFHPNYNQSSKGRLFVYYIGKESGEDYAFISEFLAIDDVVDVTSERKLMRLKQSAERGNGGQLLFGDDGYLYIFTGDGSGQDDLAGQAQDPESFLGKALRIDVNKQKFEPGVTSRAYLYDTPTSNPIFNYSSFKPEVFALGFQNPWRCSEDRESRGGTGQIFCGDTGSDLFEEINIIRGGRNYGWNLKEGNHCFHAENCSQIDNEESPIYTYEHPSEGGSAVVGGFVYRGASFPQLTGQYVFGDAVTGETFLLKKGGEGNWTKSEWPLCPQLRCPCSARRARLPFLQAFGLHSTGELLLLMSSEFAALRPTGTLFLVRAPNGTEDKPVTCTTCSLTSNPLPLLVSVIFGSLLRTLVSDVPW